MQESLKPAQSAKCSKLTTCKSLRRNGAEGVQRAQEVKPGLIILDLSMPVMNGLDAARELKVLIQHVPLLMFTHNAGGMVEKEARSAGLKAEQQFGYGRDELVGQRVKSVIPEGFAERLVADALRSPEATEAQQIGSGDELFGRRKDGSEFPIEIMLSAFESAEGILMAAAIRDLTKRKKAEAQTVHASSTTY